MKVRVAMTVEVDPEAWDLMYGCGTDAKAVREDVQTYFTGYVESCPAWEGGAVSLVRA